MKIDITWVVCYKMIQRIIIILAFAVHLTLQKDCTIDTSIFQVVRRPILLYEDTLTIIYPEKVDKPKISIPSSQSILVSCGSESFNGFPISPSTFVATCNQNTSKFEITYDNQVTNIEDLNCYGNVLDSTKRTTIRCGDTGQIFEIGYEIDIKNTSVSLISVCFDFENKNVIYARYMQSGPSDTWGAPEMEIREDNYFILPKPMYQYYEMEYNRKTINKALGLPVNEKKYTDFGETTYYLFLGSTMPYTCLINLQNFYYSHEKFATMHYINKVPMWTIIFDDFTRDNWSTMDSDLMELLNSDKSNMQLEMIVGTYGISTLPHESTKEEIDIYLGVYNESVTREERKKIPVPKLSWKLLYESTKQEAVVFISVNNPFYFNRTTDVICEDIFDEVNFFDLKRRQEVPARVTYACSYDDFKKTFPFVPQLKVKGVLKYSNTNSAEHLVSTLVILPMVIVFSRLSL